MTNIEQKALALWNEVRVEREYTYKQTSINRETDMAEALCRASGNDLGRTKTMDNTPVDAITQEDIGVEKPYAYCCNGNPDACDCVRPDHSTAFYKSVCIIPNCRNRAPASEAFCSKHRTTSLAALETRT